MRKIFAILVVLLMVMMGFMILTPTAAATESEPITIYVPTDYLTIAAAIDAANDGDKIIVAAGNWYGADLNKAVEIKGEDGAIIDDGPMHPAGLTQGFRLIAGSDGATISHLTFTTDLSIMNGAAVDDVTITQNTFLDSIQAVSNWCGCGWEITHNVIKDLRTRSGGGIGILVADYSGGIVEDNIVFHNKVDGTLHVHPEDCGGYDGSGIVLYADFRWGRSGADEIKENTISQNSISMVSDTPETVDFNAIEITDTRGDNELEPVIFDNTIEKNDMRGSSHGLLIIPDNLVAENTFYMNKF
ncbi:hypothetical protein [[Eubacterium] cellulosolvens]